MSAPSEAEKLGVGIAAHRAGRLEEAERAYRGVLASMPAHAEALRLMGALHVQRREHERAEQWLARAIAADPADAGAHYNMALAMLAMGRTGEAVDCCARALAIAPGHAPARIARANALSDLGHFEAALAEYDIAVPQMPDHAMPWLRRGLALRALGRRDAAGESFTHGLAMPPRPEDAILRGLVLQVLERPAEAIEAYRAALSVQPDHAQLWTTLAQALRALERLPEARDAYDRARALAPDTPWMLGGRRYVKLNLCDWRDDARDRDEIMAGVARGAPVANTLNWIESTPAQQQACARVHARLKLPDGLPPLWRGERYAHDRMRVGYVSKDFYDHPSMALAAGLFEAHDRARFELHAFSHGRDDGSAMRGRVARAFEHFHDMRGMGDTAIAQALRAHEIDIAVDLDGYTHQAMPEIFAHRPAPVSVTFLGYPGTMGSPHMDYIVADETVAPRAEWSCFDEAVIALPGTYQPNTPRRAPTPAPSRAGAGLPDGAFVFASFNAAYKISPRVFDSWMRILSAVPGSVLWTMAQESEARTNLAREAGARGVDPARLVFMTGAPPAGHLARHALADLMLDTLPCCAHTTASDALWCGLPLLTCRGGNFSGRVAASILHAMGLDELIASSMEEYESRAVLLARDPAALAALRARIIAARDNGPVFDSRVYARNLERAFETILARRHAGAPDAGFAV